MCQLQRFRPVIRIRELVADHPYVNAVPVDSPQLHDDQSATPPPLPGLVWRYAVGGFDRRAVHVLV
jgi:hypothetical protein